jgi:uncharacterized protein with LGFP repeats
VRPRRRREEEAAVPVRRRWTLLLVAVLAAGGFLVPAPAGAQPCTQTDPIDRHHCELGGDAGLLGAAVTPVQTTPDRIGRYRHYQRGSIYWTPATGAHEVHGWIRDKWASLGWERSHLGYPVTDETATPDRIGAYNHFQDWSVYTTTSTGANEIHGWIRAPRRPPSPTLSTAGSASGGMRWAGSAGSSATR